MGSAENCTYLLIIILHNTKPVVLYVTWSWEYKLDSFAGAGRKYPHPPARLDRVNHTRHTCLFMFDTRVTYARTL